MVRRQFSNAEIRLRGKERWERGSEAVLHIIRSGSTHTSPLARVRGNIFSPLKNAAVRLKFQNVSCAGNGFQRVPPPRQNVSFVQDLLRAERRHFRYTMF